MAAGEAARRAAFPMKPKPGAFDRLAPLAALPALALPALVLALVLGLAHCARGEAFDSVLLGGRIVDGTGAPWYVADVGIRGGKIAAIGQLKEAEAGQRIPVEGLVVAPGFVDMMGQTGETFLDDPASALNLLTQGITTINAGEGHSPAPLDEAAGRAAGWTTMAEYFQLLDMAGLPVNVAQTVGHAQVRRLVLGDKDVAPDAEQLARMQAHVREAMEAGAIGVSTALIYPPAVYAQPSEIAALAAVAGEYGGRYFTHMRNEGDRLLEAIDEALEIGKAANTPVHIFHLKAAGRQNWSKMELAIAKIAAARADGRQVTADIYPYINNGLGIGALIHPRHFADGEQSLLARLDDPELRRTIRDEMENLGGWENWYRHMGNDWDKLILGEMRLSRYARFSGGSLAAAAGALGEDPWDTFFQLVKTGVFVLPQTMSEANKERLLQEDFVSFCTDFGPNGGDRVSSHPRAFGAFPRVLARYVRERRVRSLERAVSQASAVATNEIMAFDRGKIAVGLAADVIVFDPGAIADHATFAEPHALSTGIRYVLVNGELVLEEGVQTAARPGRVLRGPGYRTRPAPHALSTGAADPDMAPFDDLMRSFIEKHRVPGAALAVVDHGRLVYARGYGYADLATHEPVTPDSLFRIASLSKPITAVAILKLAEEKKLGLDDPVFGILEFDPFLPDDGAKAKAEAKAEADPRQRQITIRHLLQHRGGWDRSGSPSAFDPMFYSDEISQALGAAPPATPESIIRYMSGRPLDFDPGARYAYSNYGYSLLGRVVEKVAGISYEQYVSQSVLQPMGISAMRLGNTALDGRAAGEVRYYDPSRRPSVLASGHGQPVLDPYGAWNLEAMDAHGGWIGSVRDLARFAMAVMDPDHCPVLAKESLSTLFTPAERGDPEEAAYGCGWFIREAGDGATNSWHTGSLPGTAALLVLRHDGRAWAVLFNSRVSPQAVHLAREIDPLLHQAADNVRHWPAGEL